MMRLFKLVAMKHAPIRPTRKSIIQSTSYRCFQRLAWCTHEQTSIIHKARTIANVWSVLETILQSASLTASVARIGRRYKSAGANRSYSYLKDLGSRHAREYLRPMGQSPLSVRASIQLRDAMILS